MNLQHINLDTAYQAKQRRRYEDAILGDEINPAQAYDALWRAASNAGLLHSSEVSQDQFTPHRIQQLIGELGWG
jgi:hypothetical protein